MKKCLLFILIIVTLFAGALYFGSQYFTKTPIYKVYKIYNVVSDTDKTADDLGLTAQQRAILKDIRKLLLQQGEALNDGGGDIFEAFTREFKSDNFNQPTMNSLVGKLLRRTQGIMPELFEKVGELHASMTPAQKSKVVEMLEGGL
jgi:hypothetical protein